MDQPLIHKQYLLHKFPGKGGWTYAEIPEIPMNSKAPFGWVCVKGSIDHYQFSQYRLMPMGGGKLFLPVKAAVRKLIGKSAGDWVTVTLYPDTISVAVPEELESCLLDEPLAHKRFHKLEQSAQKEMINWIYAAQKEATRADRIVHVIQHLLQSTIENGH